MSRLTPNCLAYIPAKGISARLPRKNILPLGDKPMVAWTIVAAQRSKAFDRIIVSTESEEVAAIARAYGAEVPFLRPEHLSASDVPNHRVLLHLLDELKTREGYVPDLIATLQPTSPLRSDEDIRRAVELAVSKQPNAVVSLNEAGLPLGHLRKITADQRIAELQEEGVALRLNGAICIAPREQLINNSDPYQTAIPFLMPAHRSIDIDTLEDLEMARAVVQYFKL